MYIQFLEHVRLDAFVLLHPCMEGLWVLADTAPRLTGDCMVVTSGADSEHGSTSLHPDGMAFDIRFLGARVGAIALREGQLDEARRWRRRAGRRLGKPHQFIVEPDHIHYEWDVAA